MNDFPVQGFPQGPARTAVLFVEKSDTLPGAPVIRGSGPCFVVFPKLFG